jgi:penicillin amidase
VAADVQDLYRERVDPTGKLVEFRGALEPMRLLKETIKVSGGDPIEIDVRITRHGPLVSDAINVTNASSAREPKPAVLEPLAFRWTALEESDDTVVAFLRLNEARNWDEFTAALRHFIVPSQNFVYADVDGHIGYYLPGSHSNSRVRATARHLPRAGRRDGMDRMDPVRRAAARLRSARALHRDSQPSAGSA